MLVEREALERDTRRLATRLRFAGLRQQATPEDVDHRAARGLDRALFQQPHRRRVDRTPPGSAGDRADRHGQNLAVLRPRVTAPAATTAPCCISACPGCWRRSASPAATGAMAAC